MIISETKLKGVLKITPPTNTEDFRGSYVELWNNALYKSVCSADFIQDDISTSSFSVLRGIHGDGKTWKLISCLYGKFYLVVLNHDIDSQQYGEWESFVLSDTNRLQVLVPPKFGNGHLVLSDKAIFHYKQSTYYDRESQFTVKWDDPEFNIWWPIKNPLVSQRDQ